MSSPNLGPNLAPDLGTPRGEESGRIDRGDGVELAWRRLAGRGPGVVFLGGFNSDMTGTKAADLAAFCAARGQAFLRFDYSGHGASGGRFIDGTIGRWAADAAAVLAALATGPQILVGSSMGGWISLLLARRDGMPPPGAAGVERDQPAEPALQSRNATAMTRAATGGPGTGSHGAAGVEGEAPGQPALQSRAAAGMADESPAGPGMESRSAAGVEREQPARPWQLAGLVGIAAAPDFTTRIEAALPPGIRAILERDGVWHRPSAYGDPYPITRALLEDGRDHLLLQAPLPIAAPVRLLHGQQDPDVPWELSLRTAAAITGPDVQVTLVKDGDHRLSRPQDLLLLRRTLAALLGQDAG